MEICIASVGNSCETSRIFIEIVYLQEQDAGAFIHWLCFAVSNTKYRWTVTHFTIYMMSDADKCYREKGEKKKRRWKEIGHKVSEELIDQML